MTTQQAAECTCKQGVLCPEASRLDRERKEQHDRFIHSSKSIFLTAWQTAELDYQQHIAKAYNQHVSVDEWGRAHILEGGL